MTPSGECTLTQRILFVGDAPYVLDDYRRVLSGDFPLETACSCKEGLATVHLLGPFAVVIAHMRMSGLSGVEFLDRVRELAPQSVRMLLAPSRDHKLARAAINEGHIFRYLTTPCRKEVMVSAIRLALAQYRTNIKAAELVKEANACQLSAAGSPTQEILLVEE